MECEDDEVAKVLQRVVLQVRGAFEELEGCEWRDDDDALLRLQAEALQSRLSLDEAPRRARRRRLAVAHGFSLHADTRAQANDRESLARLARYGARGPIAEERLTRLDEGGYRYQSRNGTALTFTAEQLVRRLVALVPPRKLHLTSWHGVYAPNAKLRSVVMRAPPPAAPSVSNGPPLKSSCATSACGSPAFCCLLPGRLLSSSCSDQAAPRGCFGSDCLSRRPLELRNSRL